MIPMATQPRITWIVMMMATVSLQLTKITTPMAMRIQQRQRGRMPITMVSQRILIPTIA